MNSFRSFALFASSVAVAATFFVATANANANAPVNGHDGGHRESGHDGGHRNADNGHDGGHWTP